MGFSDSTQSVRFLANDEVDRELTFHESLPELKLDANFRAVLDPAELSTTIEFEAVLFEHWHCNASQRLVKDGAHFSAT